MTKQEQKKKFIELRANSESHRSIADILGISKSTSVKWAKDYQTEVAELQAAMFSELYKTYGLYKHQTIKEMGEILLDIDKALEKSDFSEIPPAKLLDFKFKFMKELSSEFVDPDKYFEKHKKNKNIVDLDDF